MFKPKPSKLKTKRILSTPVSRLHVRYQLDSKLLITLSHHVEKNMGLPYVSKCKILLTIGMHICPCNT